MCSWFGLNPVVVMLAAPESSLSDQKGLSPVQFGPWIRLRFCLQMNPSLWKRRVKNMRSMYNPTEINFIKKDVNYRIAVHRKGPKWTLSIL